MSLLNLVASDNYIPVNIDLIRLFGLEEAIILGELCSQYNLWEKEDRLIDGMFYCTVNKLEERTTLSEYQQRTAIKNLESKGVIKTELKGIPATRYFYIDENKLFNFLSTSSRKIKELDTEKLNSSNIVNNKTVNKKQFISKDINCDKSKPEFVLGKSVKQESSNSINNAIGFKALYTNHCNNLPHVSKLTDARIKAINHIIKKYSREEIITVLDNANESQFLTGNNDRGWKANIDFILREDKFVSILEGKYNNKPKMSKQASSDM